MSASKLLGLQGPQQTPVDGKSISIAPFYVLFCNHGHLWLWAILAKQPLLFIDFNKYILIFQYTPFTSSFYRSQNFLLGSLLWPCSGSHPETCFSYFSKNHTFSITFPKMKTCSKRQRFLASFDFDSSSWLRIWRKENSETKLTMIFRNQISSENIWKQSLNVPLRKVHTF